MNVRMFRKAVLSFFFLTVLSCGSSVAVRPAAGIAGNYDYLHDVVMQKLRERSRQEEIVGIGFAITDSSGKSIVGGLGKASSERSVQENTIFKVGSLSKIFTGIAVLQLAENGKVILDDPAERYIPELKGVSSRFPEAKPFTVRQLLTHHSGLPSDVFEDWMLSDHSLDKSPYNELPPLLQGIHLTRPPNTAFAYSNLGFSLLSIIVERTSGYSFEEYMRRFVFDPAGMKNTSFFDDLPEAQKSEGYSGWLWKTETKVPKLRDLAATSLSTTPEDMNSFIKALFTKAGKGNKLMTGRSLSEFYEKQNRGIERDLDFEIGLPLWRFLDTRGNLLFAGHGGDLPPFSSYLLLDPENQTGVFLVSNTLSSGSTGLEELAIEFLSTLSEVKTGRRQSLRIKTKIEKNPGPEQIKVWKKWEGYYASPFGLHRLEFGKKNPKLTMFSSEFSLQPLMNGDFLPKIPTLFGLFDRDRENLDKIRISLHEFAKQPALAFSTTQIPKGGMLGLAEKVEPYPLTSEWQDRMETYKPECADPEDILEKLQFSYDEDTGFIMMNMSLRIPGVANHSVFPVRPLGKNTLIVLGHGRNLGDTLSFELDEKGGELLTYSGYRMKKVKLHHETSRVHLPPSKTACTSNRTLSRLLKNLHLHTLSISRQRE
ncbi:class A beta-lactamase-related serine hydrolase [Leptospira fluminis]|uniref:Class A beta-lactamase-related serine hydrolase n=2 Tax=Leptospira fluminis TaxID=2484979 RepID=A0A4R9GTS1_9LEPT|nr:class A beta-lactamase-related serine hydrolase [Leptospira fluminis]